MPKPLRDSDLMLIRLLLVMWTLKSTLTLPPESTFGELGDLVVPRGLVAKTGELSLATVQAVQFFSKALQPVSSRPRTF